jgi:hypothetical protein
MDLATAAGGIGCSVGRNIFMHRSPRAITQALSRVIRERWTAHKALAELEETVLQEDAGEAGAADGLPRERAL